MLEQPPYMRIVDDIRGRIASGELRPGDRVPSTRQVAKDFGVALATAAKALTTLRMEGTVQTEPRFGTIVSSRTVKPRPLKEQGLSKERIVRAAMDIADGEGLEAITMRAIAHKLDVPTMSLYRHVANKEDLTLLMVDAAFGDAVYPDDVPPGWRARLEVSARTQWAMYRRHPWVALLVPLGRPLPLPNMIKHADWMMSALQDADLDPVTTFHIHITLYGYVRGTASNLEAEAQAQADTGLTEDEWMDSQEAAFTALIASGELPSYSSLITKLVDGYDFDLDVLFEFGLQALLNGFAQIVE
ncbi:TetR/AcrR family transcriptional regulator C-terminal domain-containing protein [Nonomuraea sp. NPDC050556]|uniref:TetR/AcrR family transcriptional regulator C-terminal domain-containing protein n=1 Tax=Nonomuraea sp. NPDC050556 TaxID=3364369 RepID=UPI0037AFB8F1